MKYAIKKAVIIAALAVVTPPAAAQTFLPELDTVPQTFGLGLGLGPDYRGSNNYTGALAPFARYTFAGTNRYVQLNANELTLNLLNSTRFRLGPVLNYHFGRDDDVDDPIVKQMREIDDTVEAGVFGEMVWSDPANPRNRFILGATWLADVGGESHGMRVRLNARYWRQIHRAVDVQIGGGVIYADSDYNSTYFSVTPTNVGTSGLPFFNASSGVNEYYLTVAGVMYFSRSWLAAAGVRASKLSGDAKDSPVVSLRGDSTQFIGGIGVAYMWR
jgi:MipA family protein